MSYDETRQREQLRIEQLIYEYGIEPAKRLFVMMRLEGRHAFGCVIGDAIVASQIRLGDDWRGISTLFRNIEFYVELMRGELA